jgi:hypothetical protein
LAVGGIAEHLRSLAPRSWLLILLALALGAAGIAVQDGLAQALIFSKAGTLLVLAILIRFCVQLARSAVLREEALLATLFADDPAPCFTTDAEGQIRYFNAAAAQRFTPGQGLPLLQPCIAVVAPLSATNHLACYCRCSCCIWPHLLLGQVHHQHPRSQSLQPLLPLVLPQGHRRPLESQV